MMKTISCTAKKSAPGAAITALVMGNLLLGATPGAVRAGTSTSKSTSSAIEASSAQTNSGPGQAGINPDSSRTRPLIVKVRGHRDGVNVTAGVTNPAATLKPEILRATGVVPWPEFGCAKQDAANPEKNVGSARTGRIESPSFVVIVAEQLDLRKSDRVLEIGTGSGYQTAVLSLLAKEVYSVEQSNELAESSTVALQRLGYTNNVFLRRGNYVQGWPEAAPFDAIVLNGDSYEHSDTALQQLREGGKVLEAPGKDGDLHLRQKLGGKLVLKATHPLVPPKNELKPGQKLELNKSENDANH